MHENILIATDLSRDSDELVRCAAKFGQIGARHAPAPVLLIPENA